MDPVRMEAVIGELDGLTLGAALRRSARLHAERPFIMGIAQPMRFAAFDAWVDRIAGSLLALGVRHGDHVALWLANSPQWVALFCACARIGAVLIPINTRYKTEEAAYILESSDARVLVMTRQLWKINYYDMLDRIAPDVKAQHAGALELQAFPLLRSIITIDDEAAPGIMNWDDFMGREAAPGALAEAEACVKASDRLLICFTSGTTGKPKGAMHSHVCIKQATRVGLALHTEAGDRVLGHMPFYHVAGTFMAMIPALTLGAGLVLMQEWNADHALELIEREKVTIFGGIPTHFHDLAERPSLARHDTSSLKSAWIGGSPVMKATFEHYLKSLRLQKLLSTYGMTENTISTTFNHWDDPVELCCLNKAPRLGVCEVKIVDTATLETRGPEEDGEIWCRGETVMLGYYRNPEATKETITAEGWLRTGDIGRFDDKGYLSITGRLKDMFKTGGTNAYPVEIEQHLARHGAIAQSVVVGVPDERLDEVGFAFIQLHENAQLTAADVVAHCRGQIADYKVPHYVRFFEDFPRTSTGKIMRAELAKLAREAVTGGQISKVGRG